MEYLQRRALELRVHCSLSNCFWSLSCTYITRKRRYVGSSRWSIRWAVGGGDCIWRLLLVCKCIAKTRAWWVFP